MDPLFSDTTASAPHTPSASFGRLEAEPLFDLPARHATIQDQSWSADIPKSAWECFEGFVDYIHLWWPQESTVYGATDEEEDVVSHPFLTDSDMGEETPTGEIQSWGMVDRFEPGRLLEFGWIVGRSPEFPMTIRVEFESGTSAEGGSLPRQSERSGVDSSGHTDSEDTNFSGSIAAPDTGTDHSALVTLVASDLAEQPQERDEEERSAAFWKSIFSHYVSFMGGKMRLSSQAQQTR